MCSKYFSIDMSEAEIKSMIKQKWWKRWKTSGRRKKKDDGVTGLRGKQEREDISTLIWMLWFKQHMVHNRKQDTRTCDSGEETKHHLTPGCQKHAAESCRLTPNLIKVTDSETFRSC